jgi:hypothetical protein
MKSVNYPAFWSQDPECWFEFLDQMFRIDRITRQSTMFGHSIRKMPFEAHRDLRDNVRNAPATNPYDHLRTKTIKRLGPNNEQRLRQLLSVEELGDSTPSNSLRRLLGRRHRHRHCSPYHLAGQTAVRVPAHSGLLVLIIRSTSWKLSLTAYTQFSLAER